MKVQHPDTASAPDALMRVNVDAARTDLLHFAGATGCGSVGLSLAREPGASGPASGAEQVLRLAQAEPLIDAVEQWLRSGWDPSPVSALPSAARYRAVVRDPALAPPGSVLAVPATALLAPPPEALRAPALAWDAHDARLLLSAVPPEALASLQAGGLLWLPASFGAGWPVRLSDPAGQLPPCAARLDLAAQRLTLAAPPGADPGIDADAPQVRLGRRVRLPLDHWLGWGPPGAPFHWPVPQPWPAGLCQGDAVLARGSLLPVGDGCGLLIESLPASAEPAVAGGA